MNIIRSYSRSSFIFIIFFMALLLIAVKSACYFGLDAINEKVSVILKADAATHEVKIIASQISMILYDFKFYIIPVSIILFVLFGFLLWFFLRLSFVKLIKKSIHPENIKPDNIKPEKINECNAAGKVSFDKNIKKHNDRRLFLHLLSVFQREGRLLDFFSEDLDSYEDAQIGSAVRSIHKNCRNVIKKNLVAKPVIDRDEDKEVTVEQGFDPGAVKLTGNVTGEPPFKGILRHKGWRVMKLELPTLSGTGDSSIITPAEVEIL